MRFHETQARRNKRARAYINQLGRESRERSRLVENLARAKREARAASLPTEPVDPADLSGATAVLIITRGHPEWHRVIRVNKTTVTCWAPPGYDQPRYPHNRIFGVRTSDKETA